MHVVMVIILFSDYPGRIKRGQDKGGKRKSTFAAQISRLTSITKCVHVNVTQLTITIIVIIIIYINK